MPAKKKYSAKRAAIAKIHIAKKELGFDDDTYRDVLFYVTGERSCSDMNLDQLSRVIAEMRRKGWQPKSEHGAKPRVAQQRQHTLDKIEALLAEDGKHWNYAKAMAKHMFDKDAIEFLTDEQLHKLMQALAVAKHRKTKADAAHAADA